MRLTGKETYEIFSKEYLAEDIASIWIFAEKIAENARAGQFVSLYCDDESRLLPRPISICDTDRKSGLVRLVFRIAGKGTAEFAAKEKGDGIGMLGPLGNGYETNAGYKKVIIAGGGIGIPPMLKLSKDIPCEKSIVLGYSKAPFLSGDFDGLGEVFIATDDGSAGIRGTVIDAIRENNIEGEAIYACGPMPMLKAVKEYAKRAGIEAWVSLEERMACGIGACLACVCKSEEVDSHSMVKNKRVCKDGPVFNAREVDFS